jgi:hypothetical protein
MWAEKSTIKEGSLLTKDGKQKLGPNKWKSKHVRLVHGYILVYKKSSDSEPTQVYPPKMYIVYLYLISN